MTSNMLISTPWRILWENGQIMHVGVRQTSRWFKPNVAFALAKCRIGVMHCCRRVVREVLREVLKDDLPMQDADKQDV